jgi:hypothetical protein
MFCDEGTVIYVGHHNYNTDSISLMKQNIVVTHTVLWNTKKSRPILNRPTPKHVMFLRKCKDKEFFVDAFGQKVCL